MSNIKTVEAYSLNGSLYKTREDAESAERRAFACRVASKLEEQRYGYERHYSLGEALSKAESSAPGTLAHIEANLIEGEK